MESTNGSNPAAEAAREAAAGAAGVASTAAQQTSEVATTAVEGGRWVAAVGQEQAKAVASTAGDQVAQVAGEVGAQARNLIDESKNQLHDQARAQTDQIAAKLREVGDQVQALVEGRTQDAGAVGDYAQQAVQTVNRFAGRIEERGFDGVIDDVQRFARRKPGTFLIGAALAGFGVGRLLRAGAMGQPSQPEPTTDLAAAYEPYAAVGMSTQPALVDVTDDTIVGAPVAPATPLDATLSDIASPAGVAAGSPLTNPTGQGGAV